MEVPDAVGAVVGRGVPLRVSLLGPGRPGGGADAEWAELVEGEDSVGEALQDVLDAVELDVALGVGGSGHGAHHTSRVSYRFALWIGLSGAVIQALVLTVSPTLVLPTNSIPRQLT